MSAYGNLASARTDIGRNLSDIAGIGIEMEYGPEGRIAGQMEQSRIANQTAAIGLGLESIQQIAGFGVEYDKETEAAESVGGKEVYKKRIKDESTGEYTTEWGDKGNLFQKLGRFLGFSERQFNVEGQRYTGAQVEAAVPYTKIGKTWAEAAGLTGGGTKISGQNKPGAIWEGSFEDLGMTESEFDNSTPNTVTTSPYDITKETELGELTKWRDEGLADYQDLINKAMYGRDWDAAAAEWKNIRKGYLK